MLLPAVAATVRKIDSHISRLSLSLSILSLSMCMLPKKMCLGYCKISLFLLAGILFCFPLSFSSSSPPNFGYVCFLGRERKLDDGREWRENNFWKIFLIF